MRTSSADQDTPRPPAPSDRANERKVLRRNGTSCSYRLHRGAPFAKVVALMRTTDERCDFGSNWRPFIEYLFRRLAT